jgi:hypothetical protein
MTDDQANTTPKVIVHVCQSRRSMCLAGVREDDDVVVFIKVAAVEYGPSGEKQISAYETIWSNADGA